MTHRILPLLTLLLAAAGSVHGADLRTETVTYAAGDTMLQGYIAHDASIEGERPGVLIVHEWWGLNEHARESARKLAEAGFTALAVDMYGDGRVADHPDEAGAMFREVRGSLARMQQRFSAAENLLRAHPTVDPARLAAIGYCFGGTVVLEMARQGVDLAAVASFHGALATDNPAEPGQVRAAVLVLHGEADRLVPEEDLTAFREEMETAGADYRIVTYPGAMHSFTNPDADRNAERFGLPLGYDAEADRESWSELMAVLDTVFKR